jgi:hypothetical protein
MSGGLRVLEITCVSFKSSNSYASCRPSSIVGIWNGNGVRYTAFIFMPNHSSSLLEINYIATKYSYYIIMLILPYSQLIGYRL